MNRGQGSATDTTVAGATFICAQRNRLPRLRTHHQRVFPGARKTDPAGTGRVDADLETSLPGRRIDESCGNGMRGQRSGRKQACQYRHQPTGDRGATGGAGLSGRAKNGYAKRRQYRAGIYRPGQGLRRDSLQSGLRRDAPDLAANFVQEGIVTADTRDHDGCVNRCCVRVARSQHDFEGGACLEVFTRGEQDSPFTQIYYVTLQFPAAVRGLETEITIDRHTQEISFFSIVDHFQFPSKIKQFTKIRDLENFAYLG